MRFSLALLPTFALRVRAALVAGSSKVWVALVWSSREASGRTPYHRTGIGNIETAVPMNVTGMYYVEGRQVSQPR